MNKKLVIRRINIALIILYILWFTSSFLPIMGWDLLLFNAKIIVEIDKTPLMDCFETIFISFVMAVLLIKIIIIKHKIFLSIILVNALSLSIVFFFNFIWISFLPQISIFPTYKSSFQLSIISIILILIASQIFIIIGYFISNLQKKKDLLFKTTVLGIPDYNKQCRNEDRYS